MAGIAVGTPLVHGFIHHRRHPDGQIGGECEHESTPVCGLKEVKRPMNLWLRGVRVGGALPRGQVEKGKVSQALEFIKAKMPQERTGWKLRFPEAQAQLPPPTMHAHTWGRARTQPVKSG